MTDRTSYSAGNTTFDVINYVFGRGSFTRSNGKVAARVYERLTKASRRRAAKHPKIIEISTEEYGYRMGVRDALAALKAELNS